MNRVVDASVVVKALHDAGPYGTVHGHGGRRLTDDTRLTGRSTPWQPCRARSGSPPPSTQRVDGGLHVLGT
jgi:hypothetical protein